MPRGRKPKPPRLYLRKRSGREPVWVILDGQREIGTGCGEGDGRKAEKVLARYLGEKYDAPTGPSHPDQMSIQRALDIYGNEHAQTVAAPELIGYHIDALVPFWGDKAVSTIKGETCRAYVRSRPVKPTTARRELETLGAALRYCEKEGYLTHAPRMTLPKRPKGRTRWLTRKEAAALLRAAWRKESAKHHLATFILIGLYTGTRSDAILKLQWVPNTTGGWVDLEQGLLFRAADDTIETNKRQPPCPIPAKLLAHLKRVRRRTRRYVVEYNGERVIKLRRSWTTARKTAGLGNDVVPHALRHTCVTWLLQRGVSMWDVAGFTGMSERTVRLTYGHQHPEFLHEARDAL